MYNVVGWQEVIVMFCVLCGGVAVRYRCVCEFCVLVWKGVIGIVCELCGGVAACYMYCVCAVWWCGSVL